jgi:hypothetical protein
MKLRSRHWHKKHYRSSINKKLDLRKGNLIYNKNDLYFNYHSHIYRKCRTISEKIFGFYFYQQFDDTFEVIAVDDCSTDNSLQVLYDYQNLFYLLNKD